MRVEDLSLVRTPGDPTVSPDGACVAYALGRLDLEANAARSRIWLAPLAGAPRRFTNGPRDTCPRWSPDGRWLAFLRAGDDDPAQVHVMPTAGGEPRKVTDHPLGASALAWSPDATRLAYVARVPEQGRYGTDPDVPGDKEPPRRITTLQYRLDGVGFTIDRRAHVFVVDALTDGATPHQLTQGDYDHADPAWHPDGRSVAFVSARHADRDLDTVSDVFVARLDEPGDARRVTDTRRPVAHPGFTPDGTRITFAAPEHPPFGETVGLWTVPADGSAPPQRLTDAEHDDTGGHHSRGPQRLLTDGDGGVTTVRLHRGAVELVRFAADGSHDVLIGGRRQVLGYARGGGVVAAVVADPSSAGEIVVVARGEERILTRHGAALAGTAALSGMEEVTATAADGYPVHGWVTKPAGAGPHPVVLQIHGGPRAHYGYAFHDETQVLAGAGYAVVYGNPRGSSGYGRAHGRAIIGDFGGVDTGDVLALLDAALADPDLDEKRVGVMGGSYGGFLAAWLVSVTDRFAAAIVERALLAPDSFVATSDIGPHFVDGYFGRDPGGLSAQSPVARADTITTPTLLIHSEQDWRCPVEQAQRLYVSLRRNGVETALLLFPGEGHELSRSGLPSHRVARFQAILDWWERHLRRERPDDRVTRGHRAVRPPRGTGTTDTRP